MDSLVLSNSELNTVICALLEPQENLEIRQECLRLAGKLQPYLSSPLMSEQRANVSVHIQDNDTGGGRSGGGGGSGSNRGSGATYLLLAAADRTKEEEQQRHQGYLEDAYLQTPPKTLSASSETFYPTASSVPIAEDPPMDDTMRHFLSAVLSQARGCLPGLSVTHEHGVTAPDEVLKYITAGKLATKLTQAPPAAFSLSVKDIALHNILLTVQVCEESEVTDSIIQLDYWLNTIKLVCLGNK
jgi:hypothetical protein